MSVEVTTTVPNTTAHFASPAGPAENSDTERQKTGSVSVKLRQIEIRNSDKERQKTSNVYVKLRQMENMLLFLCTCT